MISLVDRHEFNGVEGTSKQILRHLRTLVHDLRIPKNWSDPTILSLVLFSINDAVNSGPELDLWMLSLEAKMDCTFVYLTPSMRRRFLALG